MDGRFLADRILIGGGAIIVTVGTYLPWLKPNPTLPPDAQIPLLLLPGVNAGFDGLDFVLLGMVGLVLLLRAVSSRPGRQFAGTLVSGGGIVAGCAYFLSTSSVTGFDAIFVPALGWYLTLFGGILFFVDGGFRLPSLLQRPALTALTSCRAE